MVTRHDDDIVLDYTETHNGRQTQSLIRVKGIYKAFEIFKRTEDMYKHSSETWFTINDPKLAKKYERWKKRRETK